MIVAVDDQLNSCCGIFGGRLVFCGIFAGCSRSQCGVSADLDLDAVVLSEAVAVLLGMRFLVVAAMLEPFQAKQREEGAEQAPAGAELHIAAWIALG